MHHVGAVTCEQGDVLVTEVGPGPARSAGLQVNDVILQVQGQDIKDSAMLEEIVDGLDEVLPTFLRLFDGSNQGKLVIRIPE